MAHCISNTIAICYGLVRNLLGRTSPTMTFLYAHLSPKHLTSAVRVLDPNSDCSLDSYLTIRPETQSEEASPWGGNRIA